MAAGLELSPVCPRKGCGVKTILPSVNGNKRQWHTVDADGIPLGRLASRVASVLRGKHKPIFTPHLDTGDGVIVINAEKVKLTGRKAQREVIYHHTGFPGGLRKTSMGDLLRARPERLITQAVQGMLPKNSLGRMMLRKLRVYRGPKHRHQAQQPAKLV